MIALAAALVAVALILSSAWATDRDEARKLIREKRDWKNNVALAAELEAGLKDLKDLKLALEGLKLRVGMGR